MKSHVIGNEAGDADSIISATTLVYIESTRQKHEQDSSCFNSSSGFGYTRIQRKASLKLGWNFESESNASLYRQSRHCKFSSGCSSYLGRPQCCLLSKPSGQIDLCLCNLLPWHQVCDLLPSQILWGSPWNTTRLWSKYADICMPPSPGASSINGQSL